MLLTKTVLVKWNPSNKKYYEEKGYIFSKWKDEFEVKVDDLTKSSKALIKVICDCPNCTTPITKPVKWCVYKKNLHSNNKYYCQRCGTILFGISKTKQTKLKNNKSFQQWCISNGRQDILNRWDNNLNKASPKDVLFGVSKKFYFKCPKGIHKSELYNINTFTSGCIKLGCKQCNSFEQWCLDNKREKILLKWDYNKNKLPPINISYGTNIKHWFKCLDNTKHKSELKNIKSFTHGQEGSMTCNQCNSLAQSGIDNFGEDFLEKYWDYEKNDELEINPWEITKCSADFVWIKCQNNIIHKSYSVQSYNFYHGSRCPTCNQSKGEDKIEAWLKFNNILDYIPQKPFVGLLGLKGGNLTYDFYLEKLNILIEYQGQFHDGTVSNQTKEEYEKQQKHDKIKKQYADDNNIELFLIWYYDFDDIEDILSIKFGIE